MEVQPAPNLILRQRFLRFLKVLSVLAALSLLAVAFFSLKFNPPVPPTPPIYRLSPGTVPIRFFSADCERVDPQKESFRFSRQDTCCIYANFDFAAPPITTEFPLHVSYYRADGSLAAEYDAPFRLEPSAAPYVLVSSLGWNDPGHWLPGNYHVLIYLNKKAIAEGEFEIVEP